MIVRFSRHAIAVGTGASSKALVVAYQELADELLVITAHPMDWRRIAGRAQKGRWVKI